MSDRSRRRVGLLAALRARARKKLYPQPVRAIARKLGYDVVRSDFYSPIPDLTAISDRRWRQPAPVPGIDLRIEASLSFLREELAPYVTEYSPPDHPPPTRHGYIRINGMYPMVDGEILYAMVRHLRPPRIVEIGAGFSTAVISDALARSASEGQAPVSREVFDPFPSESTGMAAVPIQPLRAQEIPVETLMGLRSGDFLIIDTTHTVVPFGDVTRLLLEIVPALAPGVVVHIHDFFRPYEYPRRFIAEDGVYWQEQYLVQALLACNDDFEVLIANYALVRAHPRSVADVIPGADCLPDDAPGSALWIRRVRARDAVQRPSSHPSA